jgi:chromosome segregation ATPase
MFGLRGKIVERIAAETHAATYAERAALVQERERERAACDAECAGLARAAASAAARVAEIKAELERAEAVCHQAREALNSRDRQGKAIIGSVDGQLEAGADPRIDEFRAALERQWEAARNTGDLSLHRGRHLAGLREAMRECDALKTAAVEDVAAALAAIRERIPSKFEAAA